MWRFGHWEQADPRSGYLQPGRLRHVEPFAGRGPLSRCPGVLATHCNNTGIHYCLLSRAATLITLTHWRGRYFLLLSA